MGITSRMLGGDSASAARSKSRGDRLSASSAGGVFRGSKRLCASNAQWRLVRGQNAKRLSPHYQLDCDYGTSILTIYNEGDPVFLCEEHLSAITPRDNCIAGVRPIAATGESDSPVTQGAEAEAMQLELIAAAIAGTPQPSAPTTECNPRIDESGTETVQPASLAPIDASAPCLSSTPEPQPGTLAAVRKVRRDVTATASKPPARDLAYGNPAKALVDETIWNMAIGDLDAYRGALEEGKPATEAAQMAGGQIAIIHRKIAEYTAKIEPMLSASKASISVGYAIDKPLEQAILEIIGSDAIAEAEKDAVVAQLGALQEQIKSGLQRDIGPLQAHRIAVELGERAGWGGRSSVTEGVKPAYRAIYTRLRDALRAFVPEARELDERLANLYAAKSELTDALTPKSLHTVAM